MTTDDAARVTTQHEAKVTGFVLKFDDLNEVEVWTEPDESRGGLQVGKAIIENSSNGGLHLPGMRTKNVFALNMAGTVRRAERRTTPEVPLLELREVAVAARKVLEVYEASAVADSNDVGHDVELSAALTELKSSSDRLGTK